ncbi:Gfo/Idh/MocA family protein [Caulobacter mirabilis]|uniref:Oxidoreductase n=1 Tax=Caulobacter mirabilis TaxID=69666 RepID=A0A2D2ASZ4_9CAUL|nr:Gfo/Idh/MocA family oxidoreductase [Caulobacter mirabilis]ATQ41132.1 oxidoreductase [Caulobacter mirabilis]
MNLYENAPRTALIGCGRWGRNIARALARLGSLEVIVDPMADGLADYAGELGVRATSDMGAAFAGDIEAVAIAAPAVDHARLIQEALFAGKHVFVEKPLALNMADATRVADQAAASGLTLMVGHLLQYHPAFVRLSEMVAEGAIGELRHVSSNRLNPGAIRTEENALWSMAPHDFSMILKLIGAPPKSVQALPVHVVSPVIPDRVVVQMRFDGAVSAQADVSWLSPFKEHKLVVLGTEGALVFEDTAADAGRKLVHYPGYLDASNGAPRFVKGPGLPVEYPSDEPLLNEMRWFLDCVRGKTQPRSDAAEAIAVLSLLEAAQAASDQHSADWTASDRVSATV